MPSLESLLAETMLFTGARGLRLEPVSVVLGEGAFRSPEPRPQTMAEVGVHERAETALSNFVWRFGWDPAKPNVVMSVTIKTRGMEMDYGMEAVALDRVEFEDVKVTRPDGSTHVLPLDASHLVAAWWTRTGEISGSSSLWRLETKLDASILACFAYQLDDGAIRPLSRSEIDEYGETLMPEAGKRAPSLVAGEVESWDVCIGPSRYVVVVELVLCRERPDFVPGSLVGFCRIHPHVFVWANEDLDVVDARIHLARPARGMACDPSMERKIGALVVADTNDEHSASAWINLPIPYTDNLYDYYDTEPFETFKGRVPKRADHPLQRRGEICLADARHRSERTIPDVVVRKTPLVRNQQSIRKTARQGQFDNVHLAARMRAEFDTVDDGPVVLPGIVMINMCMHDCVHMHVRWSEFLEDKMLRGWGPRGPFTVPGVPAVPHNQSVFVSFTSPSAYVYRAVAENCRAGALQVFMHHGAAYAVDVWPDGQAFLKIIALHTAIAAEANLHDEPYRAQIPFGWLEFYYRVRWTGVHGQEPIPRLAFKLEECMR